MKKATAALPLLGSLVSPHAFAANTFLSLERSDDFDTNSSYTVGLDHTFKDDNAIALTWSQSNSDATSTVPASDTTSYEIGLYSSPHKPVMFSLFYNGWSTNDNQEGYTVGGSLKVNSGNWRLGVHPEYKQLTLTGSTGRTLVTATNPGIGVSANYYGFKDWVLSASHYEYNYSVETRRFRMQNTMSLTMLNRLRQIGSTITASLDDSRSSVGATYYWSSQSLGVDYGRATGALDHADYWQYNLEWNWLVDDHWSLSLSANRSDGDTLAANTYYRGGISYGW